MPGPHHQEETIGAQPNSRVEVAPVHSKNAFYRVDVGRVDGRRQHGDEDLIVTGVAQRLLQQAGRRKEIVHGNAWKHACT